MRITVDYELDGDRLPLDYRRGFLSLIKTAVASQGKFAFNKFMSDYKLKPFTFSVYFHNLKEGIDKSICVGNSAKLTISTCSMDFLTFVYNGLREIKEYNIFNMNTLYLKGINLQSNFKIKNMEIIFRTLSPVLVSNKGSSDWYLIPGDSNFEEGLKFSVKEIVKEFLNYSQDFPFEFNTFIDGNKASIKKKIVWHYNMHRSGFVGVFKIKSMPEILQLIYDIGLGVRRSQGFGMLEVVK